MDGHGHVGGGVWKGDPIHGLLSARWRRDRIDPQRSARFEARKGQKKRDRSSTGTVRSASNRCPLRP